MNYNKKLKLRQWLENTFETATLGKSDDLAFATTKVDNVNVKPVKDAKLMLL